MASNKDVEQRLSTVVDALFERSITELEIVDVNNVSGDTASLTIRLSSPAASVQKQLRQDIESVLAEIGIKQVEINWQLQVPTRQLMGEDPIPEVKNVVLVMSGKGGVGKSTTAVNLAVALARMGAKVGLLDADIYGPSVPTLLGIAGHPTSEDGKTITPLERYGIKLMSIGFLMDNPKEAVIWRGPMLHGALNQFIKDVKWQQLDYLVLDLPPGTGDVALTLAQRVSVTGAVMVTTPQEVALQDVYKAVSMCDKLKIPIIGVVENMSYFVDSAGVRHEIFGKGGGQKIADFAESTLLAQIPMDKGVSEGGDAGEPITQSHPQSDSAKAFIQLAEKVANQIAKQHFEKTGGTKAPPAEGPKRLRILR